MNLDDQLHEKFEEAFEEHKKVDPAWYLLSQTTIKLMFKFFCLGFKLRWNQPIVAKTPDLPPEQLAELLKSFNSKTTLIVDYDNPEEQVQCQ